MVMVPVATAVAVAATTALLTGFIGFVAFAALARRPAPQAAPPHHRALRSVAKDTKLVDFRDPKTVEARLPPPPAADMRLWWQDIDYGRGARCGFVKCLFLSASDATAGYLVRQGSWAYEVSVQAYDYAVTLEADTGARHLFTGRPFLTKDNDGFEASIAAKDPADEEEDAPVAAGRRPMTARQFVGSSKSLVVQPSRVAPLGSQLFECTSREFTLALAERAATGPAGYGPTLLAELDATVALVEAHPELKRDFQFLIDPQGRIHHLDFDRVFNENFPETNYIVKCLQDAQRHLRQTMIRRGWQPGRS